MSDAGAARRADDAARRRPRDDRLRAGVGVRAARPRRRACSTRLVAEIDAGDGDAYLTATIHETLRRRPVLPNAAPRLVSSRSRSAAGRYQPGVCLVANAYLRPPRPGRSIPTRTRSGPSASSTSQPGTYTWIPFGGGRRRCLGASFAMLEMKIVLRAVLARHRARAGRRRAEATRRRSITLSPRARRPGRAARPPRVAGAVRRMTPMSTQNVELTRDAYLAMNRGTSTGSSSTPTRSSRCTSWVLPANPCSTSARRGSATTSATEKGRKNCGLKLEDTVACVCALRAGVVTQISGLSRPGRGARRLPLRSLARYFPGDAVASAAPSS